MHKKMATKKLPKEGAKSKERNRYRGKERRNRAGIYCLIKDWFIKNTPWFFDK
ncbi:MAG: hypothetical protein GY757_12885 [bacterium]|nr:hypothetical protein [bacterium]